MALNTLWLCWAWSPSAVACDRSCGGQPGRSMRLSTTSGPVMASGFYSCGQQRALTSDESRCLFISKKDGVASASLFQARAHAGDLDAKSVIAQTLLELAVIPGRPDRQHAVDLQRGPRRSEAMVGVQPGVGRLGER